MNDKMRRVINIFVSPAETYSELKEKKDWVFPLVVVLICTLLLTYILMPISIPAQVKMIKSNDVLTVEQKNDALQQLEGIRPYTSTAISTILMFLLVCILISGIIVLIRFIFGGNKIAFSHILSAVAYVSFVGLLSSVFAVAVGYATGDLSRGLTLNMFLPQLSGFFWIMIRSINLFGIWQTILYALLLVKFFQYSKVKAFSIMFFIFLIYQVIFAGYLYLVSPFMDISTFL